MMTLQLVFLALNSIVSYWCFKNKSNFWGWANLVASANMFANIMAKLV